MALGKTPLNTSEKPDTYLHGDNAKLTKEEAKIKDDFEKEIATLLKKVEDKEKELTPIKAMKKDDLIKKYKTAEAFMSKFDEIKKEISLQQKTAKDSD